MDMSVEYRTRTNWQAIVLYLTSLPRISFSSQMPITASGLGPIGLGELIIEHPHSLITCSPATIFSVVKKSEGNVEREDHIEAVGLLRYYAVIT